MRILIATRLPSTAMLTGFPISRSLVEKPSHLASFCHELFHIHTGVSLKLEIGLDA